MGFVHRVALSFFSKSVFWLRHTINSIEISSRGQEPRKAKKGAHLFYRRRRRQRQSSSVSGKRARQQHVKMYFLPKNKIDALEQKSEARKMEYRTPNKKRKHCDPSWVSCSRDGAFYQGTQTSVQRVQGFLLVFWKYQLVFLTPPAFLFGVWHCTSSRRD